MKRIMGMVVGMVMATSPVWAGASYDGAGRVVTDGVGFDYSTVTLREAAYAGVFGASLGLVIGSVQLGGVTALPLLPATLIVWGADRVARYRPEDIKQAIHQRMKAREATPAPGTVGELLGS